MRYRIGFADPGIKSHATERNPNHVPVVDTDSKHPYGEVVALVADSVMAERICALLNLHDDDDPSSEVDEVFGEEEGEHAFAET